MSRRGLPVAVLGVLSMACPRSQVPPTPPDGGPDTEAADSARSPAGQADTDTVPTCGAGSEDLGGVAWVPSSASMAAIVDVDDEDALRPALGALAEFARGEEHELPIALAFALGQWDFQVPLIVASLQRAGFRPRQLGAVHLADVGMAWVFGTTCDLDEAITTVERQWGVDVRRTANGAIGTPAPGPEGSAFAFDVVFLPGDRAALVAAGQGGAFVRALQDRASTGAPEDPGPGPSLQTIEPAPVRIAVAGPGLAAPGADSLDGGVHRLRASAEGVDVDGRLAPPS